MSGGDFQFKFGFDFGNAEGDLRRFVELVRSETSKLTAGPASAVGSSPTELAGQAVNSATERAGALGIAVPQDTAAATEYAEALLKASGQTQAQFDQLQRQIEIEKFLADNMEQYSLVVKELATLSQQRRTVLAQEINGSDEYIKAESEMRSALVERRSAVRAGSEVEIALNDELRAQLIAQGGLSKALYQGRSAAATGEAAKITTENPDLLAERGQARANVDQANTEIKLYAAMQKLAETYGTDAAVMQRLTVLRDSTLDGESKLKIARDLLAQASKSEAESLRNQVGLTPSKPGGIQGLLGGGGISGLLSGGLSTAVGFGEAQVGFDVLQQLQGAVTEAIAFQDAMVKVNVVLSQTGQSSSGVQAGLLDISQKTNTVASTLAQPFLQAQGAFGGAADGLKAVSEAAILAKTSGQDLSTTMSQLVVIATSFGVTASNLGQISDTVFGAFERYGTPVKDITVALKGLADTGDTVSFSLSFLTDIVAKSAQLSGTSAVTQAGLVSRALVALPTTEGKVLQFSDANNLGITTKTYDQGAQAVLTAAGQALDAGKLSSEKALELTGLLAGNPRVAPAFLPLLQSAGTAAADENTNDAGKNLAAFNAQMSDTKESLGRLKTSLTDVVLIGIGPLVTALGGILNPLDVLIVKITELGNVKIPGTGSHLRIPVGAEQTVAGASEAVGSIYHDIFGGGGKPGPGEPGGPPASQKGVDDNPQTREGYINSQKAELEGLETDAQLNAKQIQAIKDALADPGNKAKFEAVVKILNDAGKSKTGQAAIKSGLDAAAIAAATNTGDTATLQGLYDVGQGSAAALEAAYTENIRFNQGIAADVNASTAARDAAAKSIASSQKSLNKLIEDAGANALTSLDSSFELSGNDRSPLAKAALALDQAKAKLLTATNEVGPEADKKVLAAGLAEQKAFNAYNELQITEADALALALDDLAASTAVSPADKAAAALKRDTDALNALRANPTGDPLVDQKNQAEAQAKINAQGIADAARNRTEANAAQDAGFNLASAQAGKDPVGSAQIAQQKANADLARANAETGLVDAATQQADQTNAQAAQVKAAQQLKDAYNAIDTANANLQSAIDAADPVKSAQDAVNAANLAASQAQGVAAQTSAAAAQVKANRDLQNAILSVFQSQFDLLIAVDNAAGDTVKAAEDGLRKINAEIAAAPSKGINPGSAAYNGLLAQQATAKANVRDAALADKETNIQNELALKEITNAQAIVLYQQLLAIPDLTQKERTDIQLKIQALKGSVGNLNFDIPTDIALPTLYSVRRLNQTPSGQTYGGTSIDNSQKNFNFYVTGANLAQVQEVVASAIGSTTGVYGTGYRRV